MVVSCDYYLQSFTKSVIERYIYNQEPLSINATKSSKASSSIVSNRKEQNEQNNMKNGRLKHSNSENIQRTFPQILVRRQMGLYSSSFVENFYLYNGLRKLELSSKYEIEAKQKGAIRALSLDQQENRYLLSGASNASVALYDLLTYPRYAKAHQKRSRDSENTNLSESRSGGKRRSNKNQYNQLYARNMPQIQYEYMSHMNTLRTTVYNNETYTNFGIQETQNHNIGENHTAAITCLNWYPIDQGIFVTGSLDGFVKVWDSNRFEIVGGFDLKFKVHSLHMSSLLGTTHDNQSSGNFSGFGTSSPSMTNRPLIAVGTEDNAVKLCDLVSGANTHNLCGHRGAILTVNWSPSNPFSLASGSRDGTVRIWDIRRSGDSACVFNLDSMTVEQEKTYLEQTTTSVSESALDNHGSKYEDLLNDVKSNHKKTLYDPLNLRHHVGGPTNVSSNLYASRISRAHGAAVCSIKYSPCGNYLVTAGLDKKMRLWSTHNGTNTFTNYLQTNSGASENWEICCIPSYPKVDSNGENEFYTTNNNAFTRILYPHGTNGSINVYNMTHPYGSSSSPYAFDGYGKPEQVLYGHLDRVNAIIYREDLNHMDRLEVPSSQNSTSRKDESNSNSRSTLFRPKIIQEIISGGEDGLILIWSDHRREEDPETDDEEELNVDIDMEMKASNVNMKAFNGKYFPNGFSTKIGGDVIDHENNRYKGRIEDGTPKVTEKKSYIEKVNYLLFKQLKVDIDAWSDSDSEDEKRFLLNNNDTYTGNNYKRKRQNVYNVINDRDPFDYGRELTKSKKQKSLQSSEGKGNSEDKRKFLGVIPPSRQLRDQQQVSLQRHLILEDILEENPIMHKDASKRKNGK